jgi:hypothetical protein
VLVVGAIATTSWVTTPDFVYHWGFKAARFFAVGHVDPAFLAEPWTAAAHPGYPPLAPELFAAGATLAGRFEPGAHTLWTTAAYGLVLLAMRGALVAGGVPHRSRQAVVAGSALLLGAFHLGGRTAAAPDWLIALALAAAAPALLRAADRQGDWQIGFTAALAASSKLEGSTLALLLVVVHLARRRAAWRELRTWAATLLPAILAIAPWLLRVVQHGLTQPFTPGGPTVERAAAMLPALRDAAATQAWHGATLVLLLLPGLLLVPRLRALAAVTSGQLASYLWIYLSAAMGDTDFFVRSSFARLCLHLVPAALVLTAAALLGPGAREASETREGSAPSPPPPAPRPR